MDYIHCQNISNHLSIYYISGLTNLSLFRSLSGELALVRREVESLRGICQGAGDRWGWIFLLEKEQIKCNCMFQKCPE